jgi:hypothetical protein
MNAVQRETIISMNKNVTLRDGAILCVTFPENGDNEFTSTFAVAAFMKNAAFIEYFSP